MKVRTRSFLDQTKEEAIGRGAEPGAGAVVRLSASGRRWPGDGGDAAKVAAGCRCKKASICATPSALKTEQVQ
jgi:hypothetical protein